MRQIIFCVLMIGMSLPAYASGSIFRANPQFPSGAGAGPEEGQWVGQFALGFNENSGNTENSQRNGRLLLGYMTGPWRHALNFTGHRTTDRSITTAERYVATGKTDYRFTEHNYLFITAQYEDDRFAGFDRRTSEAIGYGRHLFETERHRFNGEIGLGARQVRFVDGTRDNAAIIRLAASWLFAVSESTEASSRLIIEHGEDNSYTESVTALKTNLIGPVYASLSYTVKHNSDVPIGRQKRDTHTSIQIEYRF